MKLTVQLVTWNGAAYLPNLFESLKNQTFHDWDLLIWDNGSTDDTIKFIESSKGGLPLVNFIKKDRNFGFASAHNSLFKQTAPEYVLLLNQDIVLEPDIFEKLVKYLDTNQTVASAAPRLMSFSDSDIIDSLGLKILRNRRVLDLRAGESWNDLSIKNQGVLSVFGVSAALAVYRRAAILQISDVLFDESYFSYKEDVDLAWRLQRAGFMSAVLTNAVAHHNRSAKNLNDQGEVGSFKNKRRQSSLVRYYSYKNHLATLYKNEDYRNFGLDFPFILWYEVRKFFYFLIFDRQVLKGIGELWKDRKHLKAERKHIQSTAKVTWREMRQWWT